MSRVWQSVAALALIATIAGHSAEAQEAWNPFREKDEAARRFRKPSAPEQPPLAPMDGIFRNEGDRTAVSPQPNGAQVGFGAAYPGTEAPPPYVRNLPSTPDTSTQALNTSKVERLELEPALTSDGSGLPADAWRGMDVKAVEESFASLSLPMRSPAMQALWIRLLTAAVDVPAGGRTASHFDAVRLEALYRSGLLAEMAQRLTGTAQDDPVIQAFAIRRDLGFGNREAVCQTAKRLMGRRSDLPKPLVGELHLLTGYCAAASGNAGGAGLAADLAREEGVNAPVALAALEALAGNGKGPLTPPKQVNLLDFRLLELLGPIEPGEIIDRAEPALAAALAMQENAEPRLRIAAGESAARLNAIGAEQLSVIYRSAPAGADEAELRRGELIRVIAAEQNAARRLQLMKTVMDDARRSGLLMPMAGVLAPLLARTNAADMQGHADTAIEIVLAAGDTRRGREIALATGARYWLALIDIAEAGPSQRQREDNLQALDDLVRRGRFPAETLHRLATVLDATDVNVPLPLWEAASRTAQPAGGYLPETGVLARLQEAARKREVARTVLLAMQTLGPTGAEGAHMIALGDAIRALRRVGLDRDARAVGVEALIGRWPRGGAS